MSKTRNNLLSFHPTDEDLQEAAGVFAANGAPDSIRKVLD